MHGQIVRSRFVRHQGEDLRHGVRFVYDGQHEANVAEAVSWRALGERSGSSHFNEIHAKLGALSGFLESQSRQGGPRGVSQEMSEGRVAFVVRQDEQTPTRKRKTGGV